MLNHEKLPPYGKELQQKLQQGFHPKNDVFLFLGINAWQSAKAFSVSHVVLVLPYNESPYDYHWPVNGCSILAFDKDGLDAITIEQTAHALLLAGATVVRVILFNSRFIIYRRD